MPSKGQLWIIAPDRRELLAEHVGGEIVPPISILVVDRIGQSRQIVLTHDDVALH